MEINWFWFTIGMLNIAMFIVLMITKTYWLSALSILGAFSGFKAAFQ